MKRFLVQFWQWLRAEIVFGFLIATALWAGVLGWQAANALTDAEKQKCYEAADQAHRKTEECKTFWERTTTDPVAFFTLVLAISTIGLWVATILLYRAGEKQSRHARRSAAIQTRDMQASIAAANRSAAAAERALTDLERPWLFAYGIRTVPINQLGEWAVEFTVANFGKMPAIIEHARIGFVISDRGEPPTPLFADDDHDLVVSPILQAGERRVIKEPFPNVEDGSASFRVLQSSSGEILEATPGYQVPEDFDAFFRILINYRGPNTKGHESCVLWLYQPPFDFLNRGGEEYNYTR
ncbi:hypothetical protein [Bradyrhizobium liaoningense]